MPVSSPTDTVSCPAAKYAVRLASCHEDVIAAQRLRFTVFNLELHEGLDASYLSGLDRDEFDEVCDHLLVEDTASGEIVGTYRLQTGMTAAVSHGYYSAGEFDFSPFEAVRSQLVELGRACVHRDHRSRGVLHLLWRGITRYAMSRGGRYLIGCSSVNSQDPALGWATYAWLRERALVEPRFQTLPRPGWELGEEIASPPCPPPRLLRAYVSTGAKVCGPPAIDQNFRTIDFLTWMDLEILPAAVKRQIFL